MAAAGQPTKALGTRAPRTPALFPKEDGEVLTPTDEISGFLQSVPGAASRSVGLSGGIFLCHNVRAQVEWFQAQAEALVSAGVTCQEDLANAVLEDFGVQLDGPQKARERGFLRAQTRS